MATLLSVSMQIVQQHYGPNEVMPWLSNILPDAVEVCDRWAAKFRETRNDPFTLLRYVGQDARLGIGRGHARTEITRPVHGSHATVITTTGEVFDEYTIDLEKDYQPKNT